ncbi:MAG: sigma-54-dependent Fis family transcriptional regulator, partial [Paludibacteraceae bacterium]|nr:sigma-54-dependent Fis family transcriptional regulator [Paludibacteraceae bacterium]
MASNELQNIKNKFGIIGNTPELLHAMQIAVQVANTDLSVLVTGESGVGKENFPKIIHQYSARKHNKYMVVNCGAIPEGTIDSELFGHEKGSFTGALTDRKGYFEVADGGTIFLDEVGELPLATQARLLRVLEVGEFIKVGSSQVLKTNVRVIAATNRNLPQAIKEGKFREDLYYRLNTIHIQIPPLRQRKEDIVPLFTKFTSEYAEKNRRPAITLTPEAQQLLKECYWRGNIRELKNVAERLSAIETDSLIDAHVLQLYLPDKAETNLPQLVNTRQDEGTSFSSEREILYRVLFDMKKDMDELKQTVKTLMQQQKETTPSVQPAVITNETSLIPVNQSHNIEPTDEFIEVQEYQEDPGLSVEEMEKKLIKETLEKHHGKRSIAAKDLRISERTLYRKI